ncbi:MAG TPA: hypothetical protein PKG60_05520 [Spirochaetota bacterium]|nr:hypothetical protein [Spirochaetota bacterium]HPS85130.1 hypothetical protein [Spirochaetota bacterium]
MKNKILLTILILTIGRFIYASPIAGVSGISGNTERASAIASVLEQHILSILKKNNFSTIQPEIINRELTKFNCTEEKCVLKFAENADIDLIISGTVTDKKKSIVIKLNSYGITIPFGKRIISRYEVKLSMDVNIGSREFSLITEEHAAEFLSRTLNVFLYPVTVKGTADSFTISEDLKINGKFSIYSTDKNNLVEKTGDTEITDNKLSVVRGEIIPGKSFILLPFKDKSKEIHQYYTARKREIVFERTSFYDTLFLLAVMPVASASMPFSSPFLGYYANNDWTGLGLWMVNAPPYLYIEARGLINSPKRLKEKNRDITRDDRAMNYFAWYMLAAGGMPLFIDAYTGDYLHQASYFTGNNDLLGSTATAAMLSLTSNGAGLFYKGERFWGYFYFHLNNMLLYMTMREFSAPENYDEVSGTYTRGSTNRRNGIAFCSLFALSKTIEVIHAITGKENLSSGEVTDEYIIPEPLFTLDEKGNPVFGVSLTLKF